MSNRNKEIDPADGIVVTPKTNVSVSVKIIVSILLSIIVSTATICVHSTMLYRDLLDKINESNRVAQNAIDRSQAQRWIDGQREMNAAAYPALRWGAIPEKLASIATTNTYAKK